MSGGRCPAIASLITTLWLAGVLAGFWLFQVYATTPGSAGPAPLRSPEGPSPAERVSRIEQPSYSLLLFIHPHCPCTRATLAELAVILGQNRQTVSAEVLFVRPQSVSEGWEQTSLWTAAAAIPGVRVRCDAGGVRARQLGAETSGHLILYDPSGRLLFSGGITRSRGHEGDNAGRRAVLAGLTGQVVEHSETPIFGCPLFATCACCEKEDASCR